MASECGADGSSWGRHDRLVELGEDSASESLEWPDADIGAWSLGALAKRLLDVAAAFSLLAVLTPLIVVLALAIKLDGKGPIFYRCRRIGLGGGEFAMIKFRKMHHGAQGPALTSFRDERFTRIGSLLARTKLDELPQLWNVIRGDMSLVGPRPEDPSFVALELDQYAEILRVRPGITGLSQLAFARENRLLHGPDRLRRYVEQLFPQKIAMDRLYVAQRSLGLDLRILCWTILTVFFRLEVAVNRRDGSFSRRRRPRVLHVASSTGEGVPSEQRVNGRRLDDDLHLATVLPGDQAKEAKVVILAGGKGTRLLPYTSVLPKPLLPLGDRAILEFVVDELARQGLVDITLSVNHLAHLIEAVLGNGASRGIEITYVREDVPLGTAGSLRLVEGLDDTFIVLNGDLVTDFDYREFVRCHKANGNLLTIATRQRQIHIDFGVIDVETGAGSMQQVVRYQEKPMFERMVSMGIYVLEPAVLDFIPPDGYFDFPDLVQNVLAADAPIGAFVYDGMWLDIGRPEDYQEAVALWEQGRLGALRGSVVGGQPSRPVAGRI